MFIIGWSYRLLGCVALHVKFFPGKNLFDNQYVDHFLIRQLPHIAALCEQYGVEHLELFGSATGPEFNPESSDLDFLVELDAQTRGSRARRWIELAEALDSLGRVS